MIDGGFGLYVHWPFCESKCPYCDFNSHVSREIDQDRWCAAYLREIDRVAEITGDHVLNSVYFGGGTPSLMPVDTVERILSRIRDRWRWANDIEITLEANPSSTEVSRLRGFHDAGVNRVSLGVQALDDRDLVALGRRHDVAQARAAVEQAMSVFDRVSFDLIYARQGQSADSWARELREAVAFGVDHLSLYQLTIEPGTAFGDRHARGLLKGLPDEDLAVDLYEITQEICEQAGLVSYEVSNHARAGQESRHNMIYWTAGDYAGIGPGAHGRVTINGRRHATEAHRAPSVWLEAAALGKSDRVVDPLTPQDIFEEYLIMGLRVSRGIDVDRLEHMTGRRLPETKLAELTGMGLLVLDKGRVKATRSGRMVLNRVIADLAGDQ